MPNASRDNSAQFDKSSPLVLDGPTNYVPDFTLQMVFGGKLPQVVHTEKGGLRSFDHSMQAMRTDNLLDREMFLRLRNEIKLRVCAAEFNGETRQKLDPRIADIFYGELYGAIADSLVEMKQTVEHNAIFNHSKPITDLDVLTRADTAIAETIKRYTGRSVKK